jgi:sentrin-specific protease 8
MHMMAANLTNYTVTDDKCYKSFVYFSVFMQDSNGNIVVCWEDLVICQDDLICLEQGECLNDTIIDFALQYMLAHYPANQCFVLSCSIAHLIRDIRDPVYLKEALPLEQIKKATQLLVPVNNHMGAHAGGTHWSLLIFKGQKWFHFDSTSGMNRRAAVEMALAIGALIQCTGVVNEVDCDQQSNGYDCGAYVILNSRLYPFQLAVHEVRPLIRQWIKALQAQ